MVNEFNFEPLGLRYKIVSYVLDLNAFKYGGMRLKEEALKLPCGSIPLKFSTYTRPFSLAACARMTDCKVGSSITVKCKFYQRVSSVRDTLWAIHEVINISLKETGFKLITYVLLIACWPFNCWINPLYSPTWPSNYLRTVTALQAITEHANSYTTFFFYVEPVSQRRMYNSINKSGVRMKLWRKKYLWHRERQYVAIQLLAGWRRLVGLVPDVPDGWSFPDVREHAG